MKFNWLYASVLIFLLCFVSNADIDATIQRNSVLETAVKELLNFDHLPWEIEKQNGPPLHVPRNAQSKYMQRLYDKLRLSYHGIDNDGSNTVRSMSPIKGGTEDPYVVIFELSTRKLNEKLIRAELHFFNYKKGHKSRTAKWIVYADCSNCLTNAVPLELIPSTSNWMIFDSTRSVNDSNMSHLKLQFTLNGRWLKRRDILRRTKPFLLLFSQNNPQSDYINRTAIDDVYRHDNSHTRAKRTSGYYQYSQKGQKFDNISRFYRQMEKFKHIGPGSLMSKKRVRIENLRHRKRQHNDDPMMGFGKPDPAEVADTTYKVDETSVVLLNGEHESTEACSRRDLVIQFSDIGWRKWIIAPTSFEAHYCSGDCKFPIQKRTNPSNHAIVQSVLHATGINRKVPAVSCAPDKMDSLTLLYYDERGSVVLKTYPNMVVSSCSCR